MTIKRNALLAFCLLSLSSITQPVGQLALDKALGTCYNTVARAISNNPWATVTGLGVTSLIALTCYKPYTLIAWPMDPAKKSFEIHRFRTLHGLKQAERNYKIMNCFTNCFYKNRRFMMHNQTVVPTTLQETPAQVIAQLKQAGLTCCDLSKSSIQNFLRKDLEQAAYIEVTLKKARAKTTCSNSNQEYTVFMLTPSQSNFVLLIKFATLPEAQNYCQTLSKNNPQWGCKDLSNQEEKQAGYFFIYAENKTVS